jgi:hypothetical protein
MGGETHGVGWGQRNYHPGYFHPNSSSRSSAISISEDTDLITDKLSFSYLTPSTSATVKLIQYFVTLQERKEEITLTTGTPMSTSWSILRRNITSTAP